MWIRFAPSITTKRIPGGKLGRSGVELVGDNNDLSRRDIMLIRNLQFFLRVCLRPRSAPPRPAVRGRDGTERDGTGRDGTSIGFLTNYNTRTTPLDYKLLIMPVGGPRLVPIFGGPARNFRCIIYGRFNEPRKRSKGPRGLFLIIRRRQREAGQALRLLLCVAPLAFPLPPPFLLLLLPSSP